jgi:bla regulator protein blaR1
MRVSPLSGWRLTARWVSAAGAVVCIVFTIAASLSAQAPPTDSPRFDVASVKPHRANDDVMFALQFHEGGRFTSTGSLRMLIRTAYGVQEHQLVGGPDWAERDLYDIAARAEGSPSPDTMRRMLRALLAERFLLRVRTENREMPIYALVVKEQGRMNATIADCDALTAGARRGPHPAAPAPGERPSCGIWFGPGRLAAGGLTMTALATNLSLWVDRVVTDRTGLSGAYDLELRWRPDRLPQTPTPLSTSDTFTVGGVDADAPDLFTALEEQLGLKLDAQKGPGEVFVVERAGRPIPD